MTCSNARVCSVNGASGAPCLRPTQPSGHGSTEIRDNLIARIAEAEREGWAGEAEGLKISLDAARQKLAQLDQRARRAAIVHLGMPGPADTAGRLLTAPAWPSPPAEPS